jgi:CRP/FNR family transcriptional regulator, cyclic AMP receptor protein
MSKSKSLPPSRPSPASRPSHFIDWAGVTTRSVEYAAGRTIFSQGQPATSVMYVQNGTVRLSFLSRAGAQRIVAVIDQGAFFGEGCLAGQPRRMATATAVTACNVRFIDREEMVRQLHSQPTFTDAFLAHMLKRNIRVEEDLLDQMLNHTEKRLARTLLLLAKYGDPEASRFALPKVSQELLAEMVGTNRSRINHFMNKFRKLGFIDYDGGGLKVNNSLLRVVLRD